MFNRFAQVNPTKLSFQKIGMASLGLLFSNSLRLTHAFC
jgi:hypothetical protein